MTTPIQLAGGTVSAGQVAPPPDLPAPAPLLAADHLVKEFPAKGFPVRGFRLRRGRSPGGHRPATVHAVSDVSFHVGPGETLGLVGESGCGKTTTARLALRLLDPTAGSVRLAGADVTGLSDRELRGFRRDVQAVFQDPSASLDPRHTVARVLAEPFSIHPELLPRDADGGRPRGRRDRVGERVGHLLRLVGLDPSLGHRFPHELSGGQRQRVAIARALALGPKLVVLDEPVSALDASVRADVLRLLRDLQERLGVAYLLIAHDLAVVGRAADRVAVMYLGKIVETGTRAEVYERAAHPYTQALLSAVGVPDPALERGRRRILLPGEPPSPLRPPSGCRFRTRCWKARPVCAAEEPALADRGDGHPVACHFPGSASSAGVMR